MHHPDRHATLSHERGLGQSCPHLGAVHVSMHGDHASGSDRLQLLQHRQRHEVPRMDDQVGSPQPSDAVLRQPAIAARHVRIGDDRDLHGKLIFSPVRRCPAPVAQGIERSPPERKVAGSNPAGRARKYLQNAVFLAGRQGRATSSRRRSEARGSRGCCLCSHPEHLPSKYRISCGKPRSVSALGLHGVVSSVWPAPQKVDGTRLRSDSRPLRGRGANGRISHT